jgi:hypothetical protein
MRRLFLLVPFAFALPAFAANTQCFPDAARKAFLTGIIEPPASACTANGAPDACCTAADTGATCPTYKMALVTSSGTYNCSSTTFSGTNEVSGTGYSAGGAAITAPTTEANYVQCSGNDCCLHYTTPVTWGSATLTGANEPNAAILYCDTGCTIDNEILGVFCLNGTDCSTGVPVSGGTLTVNLPNTAGAAVICINTP